MLTAMLALGVSATACTRAGSDAGGGGKHPWTQAGVLRLATSSTPNTLNPILSTQLIESLAQGFVFDPLIATDPDGHDVPVLASVVPTLENGGIGRDGLTITYHLRHGVRWQDGAPFTSRDVQFTYRAIMNSKTNVTTRHGWDVIARVATPDEYTVVFTLKRPFAPAVHTFFAHSDATYFVLPAHLLEKYPDLNRVPFNSQPVGTGPFKVVRWVRGDHIDYVANDDYFLGKPKLRRVVYRFVPDENTASEPAARARARLVRGRDAARVSATARSRRDRRAARAGQRERRDHVQHPDGAVQRRSCAPCGRPRDR